MIITGNYIFDRKLPFNIAGGECQNTFGVRKVYH